MGVLSLCGKPCRALGSREKPGIRSCFICERDEVDTFFRVSTVSFCGQCYVDWLNDVVMPASLGTKLSMKKIDLKF